MRLRDLTGQRFGRLVVLHRAEGFTKARWTCRCDCKREVTVRGQSLLRNQTVSCGCFHRDELIARQTVHGRTRTSMHSSWVGMWQRCTNPNNAAWKYYGGRGIAVCERWRDFENFLEDMGEKPPGLSLDRVDVNGNYCKENCRWATRAQQSQNRRPRNRAAQQETTDGASSTRY